MKSVSLPKAIRELRGSRTQAQFARDIGVARNTVSRWEAGYPIDGGELLSLYLSHGLHRKYLVAPHEDAKGTDGGEAA